MTETYQHHLPIGAILGEYKIEKILGEGGFGVTYLVTDQNLDKRFAIKEYLPDAVAIRSADATVGPKSESSLGDFQYGLERFLDEARTLATFQHPNLNQVLRFFKANGTAYMVLEYVEGETLADRLKRNPILTQQELQPMFEKILAGLAVVHNSDYTHRDIKPANIMLRPDGTPVLIDFGAARQALGYKSKSITAILTPGYAPIEQYDTKAIDIGPWTDIYSLGMVAYRCLTGKTSKDLVESPQRATLQRKGDLEQDLAFATDIGQGNYNDLLLKAIDWSLQVYEEDRPRSVEQLQEFLQGSDLSSSPIVKENNKPQTVRPVTIDIPSTQQTTLSSKKIIPLVMALFAVVGVVYYMLSGNGDLSSGSAILFVNSSPSGAKVYLDETFIGQTPLEKNNLTSGQYALTVSKDYYQSSSLEVKLINDEVLRKEFSLDSGFGKLTVLSKPKGAEVWLDGSKSAQLSPMTLTSISAGQHQIRIHLDGYYDVNTEVVIHHDKTSKITPELTGGNLVYYDGEWLEPSEVIRRKSSKNKIDAENSFKALLTKAKNKIPQDRFRQAEDLLRQAATFDVNNKESRIATVQRQIDEARRLYLAAKEQSPVSTAPSQQGVTYTDSKLGMNFVYIPKGCYQMGGTRDYEKPVHQVCVDGFYMGSYEVTQAEYQKIMGTNPSSFKGNTRHPVEKISWNNAQTFIRKLNQQTGQKFRLPTEAEWEYGARAGTTTNFHWGATASCDKANYENDPDKKCVSYVKSKGLPHNSTTPVGSYPPNQFGLYDMSGNVYEFCSDWYDAHYYGSSPRNNPQGPLSGEEKVARGGGYFISPRPLRSYSRDHNPLDYFANFLGFRLVLSESSGKLSGGSQPTASSGSFRLSSNMYSVVQGKKVNFRSGPGKTYDVRFELGGGFPVKLLETKGNWYKVVDYEGDEGWIHKTLVTKQPNVIVNVASTKIRTGPDSSYESRRNANKGVIFKIIELDNGWVKVAHPEIQGDSWVKKTDLWGW